MEETTMALLLAILRFFYLWPQKKTDQRRDVHGTQVALGAIHFDDESLAQRSAEADHELIAAHRREQRKILIRRIVGIVLFILIVVGTALALGWRPF